MFLFQLRSKHWPSSAVCWCWRGLMVLSLMVTYRLFIGSHAACGRRRKLLHVPTFTGLNVQPLLEVCSCLSSRWRHVGGQRLQSESQWSLHLLQNQHSLTLLALMHWCVWDAGNKTERSNSDSEWITDVSIFQLFISLSSRRRRGCWLSSSTASYRGLRSGQLTAPSSSSSCSCHWGSSGVWFGSPDGPATPLSAWNTQEGRLHYIMPAHHMTPCSQTPPPSCCYTHCTCSAVVLQTYKGHAGFCDLL